MQHKRNKRHKRTLMNEWHEGRKVTLKMRHLLKRAQKITSQMDPNFVFSGCVLGLLWGQIGQSFGRCGAKVA